MKLRMMVPFADISFSTEGVAVITVLVGGLVTAVVALWKQNRDVLKQQLEDKDEQLAALSNKTTALEKLALKATAILEREYNEGLREQGLPPPWKSRKRLIRSIIARPPWSNATWPTSRRLRDGSRPSN